MSLALHPRQGRALVTPATEVLYGGAAGGGKSHLMRAAAITWCRAVDGLQVYLFRREYPDLYKNHMDGPSGFPALLAAWVRGGFAKVNRSGNFIEFANGSKINLCHAKHESDVYGYQGAEIHVLMIDELTQWTRPMYSFLRGRLRLVGLTPSEAWKGVFPRVLCGANPGGIGHNWVKAAFVDLAPPLSLTAMPPAEGGMLRQYVPARLEDNPSLLAADPGYERRLEGLGDPALVKAMRLGDWNIVAGGMFDDLWRPSVHVVPPFPVPAGWRVDRSFDWGSSRPFSVGWWAESDGSDLVPPGGAPRSTVPGDLFRIAEWYGWNGRPNEGLRMLAAEIARGIVEREAELGLAGRVRPGPADTSIFDVENGNSIADDMARAGVRWERADKSPGSRRQGWQRMRAMLTAAGKREQPGLWVFETCRHFLRTVPVLPRSGIDPDDVETSAEDHVADEARYRLMAVRRRNAVGELW
ncbi:MAG: terminase [Alphaproteobacteria bacterium]|nr:terminase [Alphaproteobacteria bacterium]